MFNFISGIHKKTKVNFIVLVPVVTKTTPLRMASVIDVLSRDIEPQFGGQVYINDDGFVNFVGCLTSHDVDCSKMDFEQKQKLGETFKKGFYLANLIGYDDDCSEILVSSNIGDDDLERLYLDDDDVVEFKDLRDWCSKKAA